MGGHVNSHFAQGVIVADYVCAGNVKTGSFGQEAPTEAELSRREKLRAEAA